MIVVSPRFPGGSPPRVSFQNLVAGATTANFELPAGSGELQWFPADPNSPGVVTLTVPTDNLGAATTSSNSYTVTLSSGVGPIPGATGSAYFQTLGGRTFNINVTTAGSVTVYFADQVDAE